jgi:hypothetical protein
MIRIHEILKRVRRSDLEFFQEAYFWKFKKHGNVSQDVAMFRAKGDVPQYVILYCDLFFP